MLARRLRSGGGVPQSSGYRACSQYFAARQSRFDCRTMFHVTAASHSASERVTASRNESNCSRGLSSQRQKVARSMPCRLRIWLKNDVGHDPVLTGARWVRFSSPTWFFGQLIATEECLRPVTELLPRAAQHVVKGDRLMVGSPGRLPLGHISVFGPKSSTVTHVSEMSKVPVIPPQSPPETLASMTASGPQACWLGMLAVGLATADSPSGICEELTRPAVC